MHSGGATGVISSESEHRQINFETAEIYSKTRNNG